ncbi:hypothetical protein ACFOGJ_28900 [Marinibaculum pumilum]|uniref:Uncharacterized protein n=1 Tax=Marinibaculum pumilum TaxID=1766165 RepID=A0ABV7LAR3_9PROT
MASIFSATRLAGPRLAALGIAAAAIGLGAAPAPAGATPLETTWYMSGEVHQAAAFPPGLEGTITVSCGHEPDKTVSFTGPIGSRGDGAQGRLSCEAPFWIRGRITARTESGVQSVDCIRALTSYPHLDQPNPALWRHVSFDGQTLSCQMMGPQGR